MKVQPTPGGFQLSKSSINAGFPPGLFSGGLPSGKHTKNYGKSPFSMGKSTINGPFSIATLNYQRLIHWLNLGRNTLSKCEELVFHPIVETTNGMCAKSTGTSPSFPCRRCKVQWILQWITVMIGCRGGIEDQWTGQTASNCYYWAFS